MSAKKNYVKQKLMNNEICVGIWSIISSESNLDIFSKSKLDFILLDMEHGNYVHNIENAIRIVESNNCSPILRPPTFDSHFIQNALDFGIHGLIVPQIKSLEELNQYINNTVFPPKGIRGFNPFVRSASYGIKNDINNNNNEFALRSIILEHKDLLNKLDEISKIEFLDLVYIGAYDLSKSLNIDPTGSEMKKIIKDVAEILRKNNINVGAIVFNKEDFKELTNYGVNFIVYSVDSKIIAAGIDSFISDIEI